MGFGFVKLFIGLLNFICLWARATLGLYNSDLDVGGSLVTNLGQNINLKICNF
ncbi:hypothetical protein ES332_A07G256700v1 [Gossypium tomentosum]|uniref:Uncharacterized protein n=1 Tax=Gossypium tomentosum TaxID=34277 RepID=A0A5D2PX10_GOSTO|nr:hypothetical protein ES332_A07G256700v1 [Gossypium tomentosum]